MASIALCGAACLSQPAAPVTRALYLDLRKIVETNEDSGWLHDELRVRTNLEPALHSVCQVTPVVRRDLEVWLAAQLTLAGGAPQAIYLAHGRSLSAASEALALNRTQTLLRHAEQHVTECPFWLEPRASFHGQQYDWGGLFLLAESPAFVSLVLARWVPALGGGGRLLLGYGLTERVSVAFGAELAASGTLVPNDGQGLDATATIALPVLVRFTRLSRVVDLGLAPIVRFASGHSAWPPGARAELGVGLSGLRGNAFMSYTMLYLGYEWHPPIKNVAADHTVIMGTRIGIDWAPR